MKQTRVIFCSDVHLCHLTFHNWASEERMDNMVERLNAYHGEKPYEKIVFLGDYSLDHWKWNEKGSWIERGVSETARFVKDYASRLKAPYYLLPGNHEQYGEEMWKKITGDSRQDYFPVGGYLIICCDTFSADLDPDYHSDGIYTPVDLEFVRKAMAEYPQLPVILCAHYFDRAKEPAEFFDFLKNEKRITLLVCGHDHVTEIQDLGEEADHVCVCHDGHYSYVGLRRPIADVMFGFCDAVLTDEGIDIRYVEPENEVVLKDGDVYRHAYREQNHRFFRRRDL